MDFTAQGILVPTKSSTVVIPGPGPQAAVLFQNDPRGFVYLDRLTFSTAGAAAAGAVQVLNGMTVIAEISISLSMPALDFGGYLVAAGVPSQLWTTVATIGAAPALRCTALYH